MAKVGSVPSNAKFISRGIAIYWRGAALGSGMSMPCIPACLDTWWVVPAETEPQQFHPDGHQPLAATVSWADVLVHGEGAEGQI